MSHAPKTVIPKLDDVSCNPDGGNLSAAWIRILDDCVARGIPAWAGVIGQRCANASASAIAAVQNYAENGIEFGCHGYSHLINSCTNPTKQATEFVGTPQVYQYAAIMATNVLLERTFGVPCKSFGAPGNQNSFETGYALVDANMKVWFFQDYNKSQLFPDQSWHPTLKWLTLCAVAMESSTGVPSLSFLQDETRWNANTLPYVVLQAHPTLFANEAAWTAYGDCIDWLVSIGCTFKAPCEYYGI